MFEINEQLLLTKIFQINEFERNTLIIDGGLTKFSIDHTQSPNKNKSFK